MTRVDAAAIEARDVSKSFPTGHGELTVLSGVSMRVEAGEMVSIVGRSGSGKSTLLACLAGLEPVTGGEVWLGGRPISGLGRQALARWRRRQVGVVFQDYNLIPSLTVLQNVLLPARLVRRDVGRAAGLAVLDDLGLGALADARPSSLSGGQQQRAAIARALLAGTPIIAADEPTGALDSLSSAIVLDRLGALTREGRTVLLVTHDLNAAARADRVVVLRDGAVRATLSDARPEHLLHALDTEAGTA